MTSESVDSFLEQKDEHANKSLSASLWGVVAVYPILALAMRMGIFVADDIKKLIIIGCCTAVLVCANQIFCIKKPQSRLIKYIGIGIIMASCFCIAVLKGLYVSIIYILPPLASCLFFDEKFTLRVLIATFVVAWISIFYRAGHQLPIFFFKDITSTAWIWTFGFGGFTVEYLLYAPFTYHLAKTTKKALQEMYLRKNIISLMNSQITKGFANIVESKDSSTGKHILRTGEYVKLICRKLQERNYYPSLVSGRTAEIMVEAAALHDLGKISVPDAILNKNGPLTDTEFAVIKKHPLDGAQFIKQYLSDIENPEFVNTAYNMALSHHEKLDGTGYPFHITEAQIPLCARIMSAADILDALLSRRSYKKPFTLDESLHIIEDLTGSSLDANIVAVLLDSKDEIAEIARQTSDEVEELSVINESGESI